MPRITCKTPSTGKPLSFRVASMATGWVTVAEAPDFSVPDTANLYPVRDPLDSTRAVRPGEVFFLAPLAVRNKTGTARWVEVRLLTEAGDNIEVPGKITVPAGETVFIPVQGRSLLKLVAANTNGDRLQVRAEAGSALDLWGTAEEKPSSEHVGVVS